MPGPKDPIKYAEWLRNLSESHKGRPSPLKGIPLKAETKKLLSLAKMGKPSSTKGIIRKPERRIQIFFEKLDQRIPRKTLTSRATSERMKDKPSTRKGIIAWPDGLPKYVTDKISAKLRGKTQSKEHIKNRVKSRKQNGNYKILQPQRDLISKANTGKTYIRTEESLKNLSRSLQIFWKSEEGKLLKIQLSHQRKGVPRPPAIQKILRDNRANQFFEIKDNKPERMMQIALALNGIKFEKQKVFRFEKTSHAVDLFIQPNICIEIDGDHWHANPEKYNSESRIIGKRLAKDVWARDSFINHELSKLGFLVIRLWVSNIKKNPQGCAEKIIKSIKERVEVNQ